jgi:hypothetical protein
MTCLGNCNAHATALTCQAIDFYWFILDGQTLVLGMNCRYWQFLPGTTAALAWCERQARAPHIAARPSASASFLPLRGEAAGGGRCRNEISA